MAYSSPGACFRRTGSLSGCWLRECGVLSSDPACGEDELLKTVSNISLLRAYIAKMRVRFPLALLFLWLPLAYEPGRASDLALVGAKIYPSPTG
jgi:hypothetical protein